MPARPSDRTRAAAATAGLACPVSGTYMPRGAKHGQFASLWLPTPTVTNISLPFFQPSSLHPCDKQSCALPWVFPRRKKGKRHRPRCDHRKRQLGAKAKHDVRRRFFRLSVHDAQANRLVGARGAADGRHKTNPRGRLSEPWRAGAASAANQKKRKSINSASPFLRANGVQRMRQRYEVAKDPQQSKRIDSIMGLDGDHGVTPNSTQAKPNRHALTGPQAPFPRLSPALDTRGRQAKQG